MTGGCDVVVVFVVVGESVSVTCVDAPFLVVVDGVVVVETPSATKGVVVVTVVVASVVVVSEINEHSISE